jgi:hypothetical protein
VWIDQRNQPWAKGPTKIKCDNQSILKIANDDCQEEEACRRTKHIAIKIDFGKDDIRKGTIETEYFPSKQQKAICLTKSLTR